jgi:tetratricopeptide (TPR) repeat protein
MFKKYFNIIFLLLSLLIIWQLYVLTTYPAFKNDDSPETAASAYLLGIGHPPAYPLYTMAGKIFTLLPLGSPAFRVNLCAMFLSMLVLAMTYLLIRRGARLFFGRESSIINYAGVFILAFSYIFWNQAIEAKGGIYVLNLFFLAALAYCCLKLSEKFEIKYFYLMSFIYGISLCNHWPSMGLLLPVFGYFLWKNRQAVNKKRARAGAMFFLLGISAYLYLPVRAATNGVFAFMAKPDTWDMFWWTVLRSGYAPPVSPGRAVFAYQAKEALAALSWNYMLPGLFALPGAYFLWDKDKKASLFLLYIFAVTAFFVVFINRTLRETLWTLDIFLMPAQYALYLFMMTGLYFLHGLIPNRAARLSYAVAAAALAVIAGPVNFRANDARFNYISYDFGRNVINTMEPGSLFLADGDYFVMPMTYLAAVEHRTDNIKYQQLMPLQYAWGWKDYFAKYGALAAAAPTVFDLINESLKTGNVYLSNYAPALQGRTPGYEQAAKGVLYKLAPEHACEAPDILQAYSMRGMFKYRSQNDEWAPVLYGQIMEGQAEELSKRKLYGQALPLYSLVYSLPGLGIKEGVCFNMSVAYKNTGDYENQLIWLNEALRINPGFWRAYRDKGILYYNQHNLQTAREMFRDSLQYGSESREIDEGYLRELDKIQGTAH